MLIYLAAISSDEDKSKFELIYRQYRNLMYYAANQILHNSSDAEDVVHQAFLKIVEILDTISEIKSHKTRSLIVTITERKAIDLYRSKSRTAGPAVGRDIHWQRSGERNRAYGGK